MSDVDAPRDASRGSSAPDGILLLVPAFNEEASIGSVLDELRRQRPEPVVVVSDGSTDRTVVLARTAGATVLELPFNVGVGGALRLGFRYAQAQGFGTVVQVDGDGQHDPADIAALLETMERTGADLLIGSRFHTSSDYRVGRVRRWTMAALAAIVGRIAGARLTDTTSGFRVFGPRAIRLYARDYPTEYLGDTIEAIVLASRAGLRVAEAPVSMRPRSGGDASTSPGKAAVLLVRALVAVFFALTRRRPERMVS